MKKKRTFSVVLSFFLMITMMMPSISAFADAASTEITGEKKEQNITIKLNGDGEIAFKDFSSAKARMKFPILLAHCRKGITFLPKNAATQTMD